MYAKLAEMPLERILGLTIREREDSQTVRSLVAHFGDVGMLMESSPEELSCLCGMSKGRAQAILAAVELGRRVFNVPSCQLTTINSPKDAVDLLQDMRFLDREHFKTVLLNVKNKVIALETVSIGSLNSSIVHPREVFKKAIRRGAATVILAHNHPSGIPDPSFEDISVTKRLVEVGKLIGIEILDHVIIASGGYISLKESGLL